MSNGSQNNSSNNDSITTLLDGDMVERLRQLELFSSRRVEGIRTGDNPSPLKGFSSDFLQHRQYFPGDRILSEFQPFCKQTAQSDQRL